MDRIIEGIPEGYQLGKRIATHWTELPTEAAANVLGNSITFELIPIEQGKRSSPRHAGRQAVMKEDIPQDTNDHAWVMDLIRCILAVILVCGFLGWVADYVDFLFRVAGK